MIRSAQSHVETATRWAADLAALKRRLEAIETLLRPHAETALALGAPGLPPTTYRGRFPKSVLDLAALFDGAVFQWSAEDVSGYLRLASLVELAEEGPFAFHEDGRGFRLVRGDAFSICVFQSDSVEVHDEARSKLLPTTAASVLEALNAGCDRLFVHGWERAVFTSDRSATDALELERCEATARAVWWRIAGETPLAFTRFDADSP